jgi:hypothetical protein
LSSSFPIMISIILLNYALIPSGIATIPRFGFCLQRHL